MNCEKKLMSKLMLWHLLLKHVKENGTRYSVTLTHWNSRWITASAKLSSERTELKRELQSLERDFNSLELELDNCIFDNVMECTESNSTVMARSCVLMWQLLEAI